MHNEIQNELQTKEQEMKKKKVRLQNCTLPES